MKPETGAGTPAVDPPDGGGGLTGWRSRAGSLHEIRRLGILLPFIVLFIYLSLRELGVRDEDEHAQHPRPAVRGADHRRRRNARSRLRWHRPVGRRDLRAGRSDRRAIRHAHEPDGCDSPRDRGGRGGRARQRARRDRPADQLAHRHAGHGVHRRRDRNAHHQREPARALRQAGIRRTSPRASTSRSSRRSGSWRSPWS